MTKLEILHNKAMALAKNIRTSEVALIEILQWIDCDHGFRDLGYSSLFRYCVAALRLSESQSYRLITVARKSVELPELQAAIASGEITSHKACRIVSVINQENKAHWIKLASELSQQELEREVQGKRLRPNIRERIKYHSDEWAELTCEIDHEAVLLMERAKDVLSTKRRSAASLNELMKTAFKYFLENEDPIIKAERSWIKRQKKLRKLSVLEKVKPVFKEKPVSKETPVSEELCVRRVEARQERAPLPTEIKHNIVLRDAGQCCYTEPNGMRCPEKRWTEIHHVQPVSLGGTNDLENLITMCSAHHKFLHADLRQP